jgi:hypothetical protein
MNRIEIIGIIASLFVLASFSLGNILWVRVVNIIGAAIFVVYGALMGAWAIVILNVLLVLIHISHIRVLMRRRRSMQAH